VGGKSNYEADCSEDEDQGEWWDEEEEQVAAMGFVGAKFI
jgi:hypothetical protein